MLNVAIFFGTLFLICTYALIRGGVPERVGAGIFIAATILTALAATSARPGFHTVEVGILVVDVAMFGAFLALALRSTRYWPLWMTGLQAVQVAGHAARLVDPTMIPWAYAVAQGFWSYPMMAILAIGTWRHGQRMSNLDVDSSWRTSSSLSIANARSAGPPT